MLSCKFHYSVFGLFIIVLFSSVPVGMPHCDETAQEEADSCLMKSTIWTYNADNKNCEVVVGCYPRVAPENNVFSDPNTCLMYCSAQ